MTKKEFLKTISAMGFRYDDEENTWITHPDFRGTVGVANFDCDVNFGDKCQCSRIPSFKDFVEYVEQEGKPLLDLSCIIVPYDQAVVRFERLLTLLKQYRKRLRLERIKKI